MKGHGEKISRKMEAAIVALLNHPTLGAAAAASGVSESTLLRWQSVPDFQKEYREARQRVLAGAIATLQQAAGDAVETLCSVMLNPEAPASSRVTAARTVLDMSIKASELEELTERISALEQRAEKEKEDSSHPKGHRSF
jgi:hypothetical protein